MIMFKKEIISQQIMKKKIDEKHQKIEMNISKKFKDIIFI